MPDPGASPGPASGQPAIEAQAIGLSVSHWAALRFSALSRLILAALIVMFAGVGIWGTQRPLAADHPVRFLEAGFVYLGLALLWLVLGSLLRRGFRAQLLAQVGSDLVFLTLLLHFAGGLSSGLGVVMVAVVAGAAVITPRLHALAFAAAASLLLLGESLWRLLDPARVEPVLLWPAALTGAAAFAVALGINWLAERLGAQERLARQRGADLEAQLALTERVMAELPQGVVVLDADGGMRLQNRAARGLLGDQEPWQRQAVAALPRESRVSVVQQGRERILRLQVLGPEPAGGHTLIVVEDQHEIEERARQLKLASMGRLSASIAHEIRNPLAAIRHANGLLAERTTDAMSQRLVRIVEDNSVRIDRIVADVLSIARRDPAVREPVDLAAFLVAWQEDYSAAEGIDASRIALSLDAPDPLLFDPRHLRQVLQNLVGNALRYASAAPGAVRLHWLRDPVDRRLEFIISDDGPGLSADMLEHVFEPFYTTEVRGTGLGLYLAREFCVANRASLRYETGQREGFSHSRFVLQPEPGVA